MLTEVGRTCALKACWRRVKWEGKVLFFELLISKELMRRFRDNGKYLSKGGTMQAAAKRRRRRRSCLCSCPHTVTYDFMPFCVQMQWLILEWWWKKKTLYIGNPLSKVCSISVRDWSGENLCCSCRHRVCQRLQHNELLHSWGCDRLRLLCSRTGSGHTRYSLRRWTEEESCRLQKYKESLQKRQGK